jgi:cell division protein FtsA
VKFKTAMDVRIGLPNEHLTGTAHNEINQPMYATSVGLIMRGFEHLETYKKSFNAGRPEDFVRTVKPVLEKVEAEKPDDLDEMNEEPEASHDEEKVSIADRIKNMLSKMFEVEDQKIS